MTEILPPQAMLLDAARRKQNQAADPTVSAWVRANAGTGKTHVLVTRILRLLIAGASARSILCLTFTKNAAAEMEARVLGKLGEWATAGETELNGLLTGLLDRLPTEAELATARCLFASVIDAPGGLPMMTIHSFCERVLRRFGLEANVPPGFSILTEEEGREALREATGGAFALATHGLLGDALTTIVAYAGEDEFGRVLQAMLSKRGDLAHLLRLTDAHDPVAEIAGRLRKLFTLAASDTSKDLLGRCGALLDQSTLKQVIAALSGGTKTDADGMERFQAVLSAGSDETRFAALRSAFCTKDGGPRKSLMTAAVKKKWAALCDDLLDAQAVFVEMSDKLAGLKAVEATTALLRLTVEIFERYEAEKRARGALDFDDLIEKTRSLLSRQEAAEWVLYELDSRIDHILLDEAQDTSPEQWAILERLTSDFFAGQGARETVPTLFAVGDEKQSIYGFQGAAPELLAENGYRYEKKVRQAGLEWCSVNLDLSFRTLEPILSAVDGVTGSLPAFRDGTLVPHAAYRKSAGGLVEIWEPEQGERKEKGSVWEPEAEAEQKANPAQALAKRIADQIKHWLDSGEGLASCGRPIGPGDILILLRKRAPMAPLLQEALKQAGIPVAGADRVGLLDTLAIMDLLALVDALLLPEDDLALAAALKSPLLGLNEDDLFHLAYARPGSLWDALQAAAAQGHPKLVTAAARLNAWRVLAFTLPPFDFFARILEAEGGREAFAARLGPECFDTLNELLALAANFGRSGKAFLTDFVSFMRESASEVKRETDQAAREVRIMTVHGAKGLEANIVILADTCSNNGGKPPSILFIDDESGKPPLPVWAVKGTSALLPIAAAKEAGKASAERELGRLLYVAMTRARDRLYVAGFHNAQAVPEGSWYDVIRGALAPQLADAADFAGRKVQVSGSIGQYLPAGDRETAKIAPQFPSWIERGAPAERQVRILSPSRLAPWIEGETTRGETDSGTRRETAREEGNLVHRLLEILPKLELEDRHSAAQIIASAFSGGISYSRRKEAIDGVFALLSDPSMQAFFQHGHAEAGLGMILNGRDSSLTILMGQADRIHVGETGVTVLDYKSSRHFQDENLPRAYLAQLAAYSLALQRIYPESDVDAALLNTRLGTLSYGDGEALASLMADLRDLA